MRQREVEELAEIINSLPNYTEEHHISKYLIIDRTARWLEAKSPDFDVGKFGRLCWKGN